MRECDGCTQCCQGHLQCEVLGNALRPGRPCHYVGEKGCTVYEERPEAPCRTYLCAWRQDNELPMWFKPNVSGIIVTKRPYAPDKFFWDVQETRPMGARYLMWLFARHMTHRTPMRIWIEGFPHMLGPEEFHQEVAQARAANKPLPAA